jgi:hypothetical protein
MFVNLKCPYCGLAQQAPAGPMPTIAACAQCGSAIDVPGAMPAAQARFPAPQMRYGQPVYGPQRVPYPPQGFYPAPPRRSNTAGLVIGLLVAAGFVALVIVGAVASVLEEAATSVSPCAPIGDYCAPTPQRDSPVEWQIANCSEGQYVVKFPGTWVDKTRKISDPNGRLISNNRVCDEHIGHFEVTYIDYPSHGRENDAVVLGSEIDVLVEFHGCQPDIEREITLKSPDDQEFAGRELSFQLLDNRVRRYRIYIVKNRLFLVWAEVYSEKLAPNALKFLASFRLIGNIPKEGWPSQYLPDEPKPDRGTAVPKKKEDRGTAVPEKK